MYFPTIHVKRPQQLRGLRPGQWINYDGAQGRYMGRIGHTVWIAWGGVARKRFQMFANAFKAQRDRPGFRLNPNTILNDGRINRIV